MKQLWAPWRIDYILGPKPDSCVFCLPDHTAEDAQRLVLFRGQRAFVIMLAEEQAKTGIGKLKLGYNRVFGYYFEISRAAHSGAVPYHFIRRQSLANAERFTTEELKNLEEELLSAADKRKTLEYSLFQDLRTHMPSLPA